MRRTVLVRQVEKQIGQPLTQYLLCRLTEVGPKIVASELGIPSQTLNYWVLALGIHCKTVCLKQNEIAIVRDGSGKITRTYGHEQHVGSGNVWQQE